MFVSQFQSYRPSIALMLEYFPTMPSAEFNMDTLWRNSQVRASARAGARMPYTWQSLSRWSLPHIDTKYQLDLPGHFRVTDPEIHHSQKQRRSLGGYGP